MDDFKQIADDIYRDRILRARRIPGADKLMEGPRLFEIVCERMKAGIRSQFPDADEDQVYELLLRRLRRLRSVEEHAVYMPLGPDDERR